jgi:hypothetical protein
MLQITYLQGSENGRGSYDWTELTQQYILVGTHLLLFLSFVLLIYTLERGVIAVNRMVLSVIISSISAISWRSDLTRDDLNDSHIE